MNDLLKCPDDLFNQIEKILKNRPELLSAYHWHELMSGREAFTEEQILDKDTKHDLAGWIVTLTPNAARFEHFRHDVDEFANEILEENGRNPIPLAIHHSDEESMRKIIARRAEQERIDMLTKLKELHIN